MKLALLVAVTFAGVLAVASADADTGYFIPKAFYKLDAEGHKSNLSPVSPHTVQYLRRLRRQVSSSSSSSSSSVTGDDGKVYFTNKQSVHHSPPVGLASRFGDTSHSSASSSTGVHYDGGPVYFNSQQSVHGGTGPDVGLASRFGGTSGTTSSGKTVETTGYVDEKGVVHYHTKTKHL